MAEIFLMRLEQVKQLPLSFAKEHFPARLEKTQRFVFEKDRLLGIGAGALITFCLNLKESDIGTGQFGKPFDKTGRVHFNLSHSGECVVLAVDNAPVGIDIEHCTRKNLIVARKVFTPREREWLGEDVKRFEQLWTLKESVMKACGKGFYLEPASFEVLGMMSGESVKIENVKWFGFTNQWKDYTVALCSQQPIQSLKTQEIFADDILKK